MLVTSVLPGGTSMSKGKRIWLASIATSLALGAGMRAVSAAPDAGNAERGRELAPACAACHGPDGNSPSPAFPIIAGQHEAYLYSALLAYRDRGRDNAIMSATLVGKNDQDLRDLAAWFAGRSGLGARAAGASAGVAAAATASGALLAEGGSLPDSAQSALPDEARCPSGSASVDTDGDGLPDAFDAAPRDANEFVIDTNDDGRFEVCSIEQLQAVLTLGSAEGAATGLSIDTRMARDYELVRDIDAAALANWQPIGNCGPTGNCMNDLDKYGFKGSFDGRGHVISNLRIDVPDSGGVGLFGVISGGKVVRNVELRNVSVKGRAGTGTVVGSNFGTVYNCHSIGGTVNGMYAIGGLVGANAGSISYSHAAVEVSGEMAAGGLVGDQNANVFSSYAEGNVSGVRGVGGLVGLNTRGRVVSSYATGAVSGAKDVGGLVGLNTDALLAASYATGDVAGSEVNAGGLVGFNSLSRIRNSYATGAVSGAIAVGGVTGTNNGIVFQSFAAGPVSGATDVGGLVGQNAEGEIISSYSLASSVAPQSSDDAPAAASVAVLRQLDGVGSGWAPDKPPAEDSEFWYCDTDGSGTVERSEQRADNYAWDMGTATQLPALRCTPGGVARQRG